MKLKKILDSGGVLRYHCALLDKQQFNSAHQWEVAVILRHIYPEARSELLFHALTHDTAEAITGDLPAPIKRQFPDIKAAFEVMETEIHRELDIPTEDEFTEEELTALKYADILSGLYFTTQRVNCGDKAAIPIRDNWLEYLGAMPFLNHRVIDIIEELKS